MKKISVNNDKQKEELSRRGKRSKNKGASFERSVAKIFKEHYDIDLVRTPQSGGFAKKYSKSDEYRGDITTVNKDEELLLHIECKSQKTWKLKEWLEQAESDCPEGRTPIIVFHKHNSSKNYVTLDLEDFLHMVDKSSIVK